MMIIRPIITEKTLGLAQAGHYTFEVDQRANKVEIARTITKHYSVKVTGVSTLWVVGEQRRTRRGSGQTRDLKKAIVTVAKGQKITGFEIEAPAEKKQDKKSNPVAAASKEK